MGKSVDWIMGTTNDMKLEMELVMVSECEVGR